jgi:hypothetical protein
MAQLQGYLMMFKTDPAAALAVYFAESFCAHTP